jgi:hypothetical protein
MTLRPCHSPLSDFNALRDLTRNRQGEPAPITPGSEVTSSATRDADLDPVLADRAWPVAIGDKINSNVRTARGIFTFSEFESEVEFTRNYSIVARVNNLNARLAALKTLTGAPLTC